MEATQQWGGVRKKFLTPSGLASNIKQLLGMLGTPRLVGHQHHASPAGLFGGLLFRSFS